VPSSDIAAAASLAPAAARHFGDETTPAGQRFGSEPRPDRELAVTSTEYYRAAQTRHPPDTLAQFMVHTVDSQCGRALCAKPRE
jgi:hypothetical protein